MNCSEEQMDFSKMMARPGSPSCDSDWSMEQPIGLGMERPGSPSCMSDKSKWSMEQPIGLNGAERLDKKSKMVYRPGSPGMMSDTSDWSMEQPIGLNGAEPLDKKSKKVGRPRSPSSMSTGSDRSMGHSNRFKGTGAPDNTSVMSEEAPSAVLSYMSMATNPPREELQEHRPSPRSAEAGDVACDLCEGRKLKAYKSCMTCLASFCETHVRDHYTVPALQRHLLVEVTENLSILQENAQLKKIIKDGQKEKMVLRKEITALKQTICELRLPEYICKGKIPAAADLKLDADTAHCALVLSDDGKRLQLGDKKNINPSTQRFDKRQCVLATEGFSSGRLYWEVEVNREFTIGVTRGSAQRTGMFNFSPPGGYWCLYHYRQSFTALEEPSKRLPIDAVPRVLGVCVDMNEKWVTFYNAETKISIYTFKAMNFPDGEEIYPLFSTLEKSAWLRIMPVRFIDF